MNSEDNHNGDHPCTLQEAIQRGLLTVNPDNLSPEAIAEAEQIIEDAENDHSVEGAARRAVVLEAKSSVLASNQSNHDGSAEQSTAVASSGVANLKPFVKGDPRINRKGREPGRSMRQLIRALAEETKLRVINRMVTKALRGDVRAAELLLKYADAPWVADVTTTEFTLHIASPRDEEPPLEQLEGEIVDDQRQALPPG